MLLSDVENGDGSSRGLDNEAAGGAFRVGMPRADLVRLTAGLIGISGVLLLGTLSAASAPTPQVKTVEFFQEKHVAPMNDHEIGALLRKHTAVFQDLKTGKEFKAYYDDDPTEDVANRYDASGKVIPWSIDRCFVFEETSDNSFRKFAIYRYDGVLYVCGYHGDNMCTEIIAKSLAGNRL
jgi:hypothetical protein